MFIVHVCVYVFVNGKDKGGGRLIKSYYDIHEIVRRRLNRLMEGGQSLILFSNASFITFLQSTFQ